MPDDTRAELNIARERCVAADNATALGFITSSLKPREVEPKPERLTLIRVCVWSHRCINRCVYSYAKLHASSSLERISLSFCEFFASPTSIRCVIGLVCAICIIVSILLHSSIHAHKQPSTHQLIPNLRSRSSRKLSSPHLTNTVSAHITKSSPMVGR